MKNYIDQKQYLELKQQFNNGTEVESLVKKLSEDVELDVSKTAALLLMKSIMHDDSTLASAIMQNIENIDLIHQDKCGDSCINIAILSENPIYFKTLADYNDNPKNHVDYKMSLEIQVQLEDCPLNNDLIKQYAPHLFESVAEYGY